MRDRVQFKLLLNLKLSKMKKKSLWAVALLCSVLFLSSCSQNDDTIPNQETSISKLAISDPQVKKEIEFMKSEKIIDQATYDKWQNQPRWMVIYSSDILIDEKGTKRHDEYYVIPHQGTPTSGFASTDSEYLDRLQIQKDMLNKNGTGTTAMNRMHRAQNMFDSNGGTITLRLFTQNSTIDGIPSLAVSTPWKTAIASAVNEWNNLGLKVQFNVVNATNTNIVGGYVNVYMTTLPNSLDLAGTTPSPSPGYFGERIMINTAPSQAPTDARKKLVIIHELGHVVGFKHNEALLKSNGNYNTNVYNTPLTCTDINFMNGTHPYNQAFTAFTDCEKSNLQYYWGY